jgi:hypothetical protein
MSPPGGLANFHRALPGYVKALSTHSNKTTEASIGSMASFTLGSMEITPNKHGRRLLGTQAKATVVIKSAAGSVGGILGK